MILVTGGTGFVGSHLVKRLALEKIKTRCLVRKRSNVERLKEHGIELAYGDLTDKESLKKALEGVETVIHLIGIIVEKKPVVGIPIWLMWPAAYIFERVMEKPPITTQQLIMLKEDNICDIREMQEVFDIQLMPLRKALKTFL